MVNEMSNEIPVVSVIIPVYNAEAYLPVCIASLSAQTLTAFEAVFVDDGSADRSLKLLEEAASQDRRIRVIPSDHKNAGAARNKGLKEAKGRYISFLDVDDDYDPSLLQEASQLLDSTGADLAVYHFKELRNDGVLSCRLGFQEEWMDERRQLDPKKDPERAVLFGGASVWNKMYRAQMLRENALRFDEIGIYNDLTFVLLANLAARKIVGLDKWLYTYRCNRPQSISEGRGENYQLVRDALDSFVSQLRDADSVVISIARAHFLIKTLLMDIGNYRQKQAEDFYRYCRRCLKGTQFDKKRIDAFYPQLNTMIRVFRILSYRWIRMMDMLGIIKYLRRRIHGRKEQRKRVGERGYV